MIQTIICLVITLLLWTSSAHAVRLGLDGNGRFTFDGVPTFLLGVSYFDTMDWRVSDLDGLRSRGFNLIRVFADWRTSEGESIQTIFDANGNLNSARATVLRNLIQAANARRIVVDLSILIADVPSSGTFLTTQSARRAAVQNTVDAFGNEPNVFFDLVNEHEQSDWAAAHAADIATFVSDARSRSASAIVFVSGGQGHHLNGSSEILETTTINEEVAAGIQVLAPHNVRTQDWSRLSQPRAAAYRDYLANALGRKDIPVYFQEENRHGFTWPSTVDEFIAAAVGCKTGGCAGWVFHTAAGFDLSSHSFFDQLNPVELDAVNRMASQVFNDQRAPATPTGLRIQ